jgi:hypothetical protein
MSFRISPSIYGYEELVVVSFGIEESNYAIRYLKPLIDWYH